MPPDSKDTCTLKGGGIVGSESVFEVAAKPLRGKQAKATRGS